MAVVAALRNSVPNPVNWILCELIPGFPQSLSVIINEYVIGRLEFFGGKEWRKYFGVDVGDPSLPAAFCSWCYDLDAHDLFEKHPNPRQNFETHVVVYRPEFINGKVYTLDMLRLFTKSIYWNDPVTVAENAVFTQYSQAPAESKSWLALRKDIVARNLVYSQQKNHIKDLNTKTNAQYESETALLDLVTVVVLWYSLTKERLFSMKNIPTYVRCKDLVKIKNKTYPSIVGHFCYLGLDVSSDYVDYGYPGVKNIRGVALLRKFEGG